MSISQIKIEKVLPNMMTWFPDTSVTIYRQCAKCGRKNCQCASGQRADRHFAQYAFWRQAAQILSERSRNDFYAAICGRN